MPHQIEQLSAALEALILLGSTGGWLCIFFYYYVKSFFDINHCMPGIGRTTHALKMPKARKKSIFARFFIVAFGVRHQSQPC
jgi:hypothetical protein